MYVLSDDDIKSFDENGYLLINDVVPQELLDDVLEAAWSFLGMDPKDSESWYPDPPRTTSMVEIYQHQALWNTRQHPKVHQVFADILGTDKLWTSIDRVSMNPPVAGGWAGGGSIHWDMDIKSRPLKGGLQGVLYLTDTVENQGGFQCVPGFHKKLERWVDSLPPDSVFNEIAGDTLDIVPIPGNAGDLTVWDTRLPHFHGNNRANQPRMAQYITMFKPSSETGLPADNNRIRAWQERLAGLGGGDKREREFQEGTTAKLTPLGRKLLGIDNW